jgi:hypothetical protein
MVKLDYLLKIDKHWINTKKWWDSINESNELFPKEFKKFTNDEKNIFRIKFLYFIKKIFDINDIKNIDKIDVTNYDIKKLINNFKLNFDTFKTFIEDDIEMKNIFCYVLNFREYFPLLKKKFVQIMEPLLNDEHYDKLFRCDNDLTRLFCPIGASVVYIYLMNRDVYKTINECLTLDNISIQFFVISYLILDNFMDDSTYYAENKIIFLKWFMNIIINPGNEVIINDEQNKIWQCITFKKYFCKFVEKYPVSENKILYDFVKLMIRTLKETDVMQKNSNITDDMILECTFKKSYVTCFFVKILINKHIKHNIKKKDIKLLCKMAFLIQLCDDYTDINKDLLENNYTYLNSSELDFNNKIKKIIYSSYLIINDLEEKNNNINNIVKYIVKYVFLGISYNYIDKLDKELINYLLDFTCFDLDMIEYFDNKSYNEYTRNIILNLFRESIINWQKDFI